MRRVELGEVLWTMAGCVSSGMALRGAACEPRLGTLLACRACAAAKALCALFDRMGPLGCAATCGTGCWAAGPWKGLGAAGTGCWAAAPWKGWGACAA